MFKIFLTEKFSNFKSELDFVLGFTFFFLFLFVFFTVRF